MELPFNLTLCRTVWKINSPCACASSKLVWRRQPPERVARASGQVPIQHLSQRNFRNYITHNEYHYNSFPTLSSCCVLKWDCVIICYVCNLPQCDWLQKSCSRDKCLIGTCPDARATRSGGCRRQTTSKLA